MNNLTELIKQVKDLDEKATPGPWKISGGWKDVVLLKDGSKVYTANSKAEDATLVANYRTAAPKLALALEAVLPVLEYYATHRKDGSEVCHECKRVTIIDLGDNGQRAQRVLAEVEKILEEK